MENQDLPMKPNFVDRVIAFHAKHSDDSPIVKFFLQSLPIASALDSSVSSLKNKRSKKFFEKLEAGHITLTDEVIKSDDFLHCFFITYQATIKSRRDEKISLIADFLINGLSETSPIKMIDEFEEYACLLDELSYREIIALIKLRELETPHKGISYENSLKRTDQYWGEFLNFLNEIEIEKPQQPGFLKRLERSGCYRTFQGLYLSDTGGIGETTSYFDNLYQLLTAK